MPRRSSISFARSQNKSLEHIAIRKVWSGYALDYCGHLADIMASWILVSYWWRSNSHCFGDRRDRGGNKGSVATLQECFDKLGRYGPRTLSRRSVQMAP